MIIEVIGGIFSRSLAILTDAAHMLSDVGGFGISMFSIWVSKKLHNSTFTYGYHRAEILGALGSIMIIWGMVLWLVWEATDRIIHTDKIDIEAWIMLLTAFISLACNIFSLIVLGHVPCIKSGDKGNFMDKITSVYKPHGGHSCSGHDHGHGHNHDHGHSHDHAHGHKHDHSRKSQEHKKHDCKHDHNDDQNLDPKNLKEHEHSSCGPNVHSHASKLINRSIATTSGIYMSSSQCKSDNDAETEISYSNYKLNREKILQEHHSSEEEVCD
jgi:zinc transporter 2